MKYKLNIHYTLVNGRHYVQEADDILDFSKIKGTVTDVCEQMIDAILTAPHVYVDTPRGKAGLVTAHIAMVEIELKELEEVKE